MKEIITKLRYKTKNLLVKTKLIDPFRGYFKDLEFETTTYCNRKCIYCPNSKYERTDSENGRYMKQEIFEKLLSDLADANFKGLISPHLYGEPLTDSRLANWVSRIKKMLPRATIKIVTNGDFLDERKYEELVNAGVDFFIVSKHDLTLSQNVINLLNNLTKKECIKKIKIQDYYQDYRNKQDMLNTRGGEIALNKKKDHPVNCLYVTYPVINTFGDVILCCNDYHSGYRSGNIMERHLLEIWRDPNNVKLRKKIYKGIFDLPICQNCWI